MCVILIYNRSIYIGSEFIIRIFVTEFADSKREIEHTLNISTDNVIEHLLKLYCMPNSENRNHWCTEISNFLCRVKRFAGKNKFPTVKQIYNWTYFKWKDLITDINFFRGMVDDIEFDYSISINGNINTMSNEFDYICEEYFNWLAGGLSMFGRVSRQDIFNKLNELF